MILGPDGWIMEIYMFLFYLEGPNLKELVEEIKSFGFVQGILNSTFLALIPKFSSPNSFNEFRPISL